MDPASAQGPVGPGSRVTGRTLADTLTELGYDPGSGGSEWEGPLLTRPFARSSRVPGTRR